MSGGGCDEPANRGDDVRRFPTTESTGRAPFDTSAPFGSPRRGRRRRRVGQDDSTFISLAAHMAVEPFVAIMFIVAPWMFGFADAGEAKTISIVIGLVMLATGLLTRWRMALLKVIPLGIHRAIDLVLGAMAIASPYIFGFSDVGGAARFLLIVGIIELDFTVLTRWTTK